MEGLLLVEWMVIDVVWIVCFSKGGKYVLDYKINDMTGAMNLQDCWFGYSILSQKDASDGCYEHVVDWGIVGCDTDTVKWRSVTWSWIINT